MSVMLDLIVSIILRGGIYALVSMGFSLVLGVMNISNFAHGEFYMLGAYAASLAYTTFGPHPLLAMLSGGLASFVAASLVERGLFYPLRKRSKEEWLMNSFLLTAGLSFALQNAAQLVWGTKYRGIVRYWEGTVRLPSSGMNIPVDRVAAILIAILAIAALWLFLNRTMTGRAIRAVAEDEAGAMLCGIDLDGMQTLAFALGCMLAGLAGAILLPISPAFPTVGTFYFDKAWFVVILMGLGNVAATIPGGFIVGMLETIGYYFLGKGWQDLVTLCMLILILLFKPSGLLGSQVKGAQER